MTIQILGLRENVSNGRLYTAFFRNNWNAPNHRELFANLDLFLNMIPENERYNLFYTVNNSSPNKAREFVSNNIYAFDLDKIDLKQLDKYIELTLGVLKVSRDTTAIICSGNGLHFLIETKEVRDKKKVFNEQRQAYSSVCNAINTELEKHGLSGHADPQIFDAARILRLPGTVNKKKDKEDKQCYIIQPNLIAVDYSLSHSLGIEILDTSEFVSSDSLSKSFPSIDSTAVLSECELFKTAIETPEEITENNWKAMINICTHLENGNEIAHKYSERYSGYSREETESKYNASTAYGPVLCRTVEQRYGFDKCKSCIHYRSATVRTPIQITGKDFIATRDTGFRRIKPDGTPGAIQYEDLVRFFRQEVGEFVTEHSSGSVWTWKDKYWQVFSKLQIKAFCNDYVMPPPRENDRIEFYKTLQLTNFVDEEFFNNTENKINLTNGVLDLNTMKLEEHSSKYGFRYILDYDYDPEALCPKFDAFLDDVTQNDKELQQLLMEYAGYCFSDSPCLSHKAMIMLGGGSNGKSTLIGVLEDMAGTDNFSSLTLRDLSSENSRAQLIGKLFNVAEETPLGSMKDSSIFKTLVAGGTSTAKILYQDTFSFKNKTKFLFAANDMPKTVDTSTGLMRRLIIAPFNASFKGKNINRSISKELKRERSGILNRFIKGLIDLKKNEWAFTEVNSVRQATDEYELEINDVAHFSDECLIIDNQFDVVPLQKIYDEYVMWCDDSGRKFKLTKAVFGKKLKQHFPTLVSTRKRIDGVMSAVYRGIGLGRDFKKY